MKKRTFILFVAAVAVLLAIGVTITARGEGSLTTWLKSLHGTPRH